MIAEFIYQAKQDYNEIKAQFPDVTNVTFELEDVPLAEINQWANDNNKEPVECKKDGCKRLLMLVCLSPNMFVYSKNLKVIKPELIEEEILA